MDEAPAIARPFITAPVSVALDAIRAMAAFLVLMQHATDLGLYTGPYPFTQRLSHNCVVVFFVLSGLVISSSVQRRRSDLIGYAIARVARIVPTAMLAVAVSCAVAIWIAVAAGGVSLAQLMTLSLSATTSLLFVGENPLGHGLFANAPYWSLDYEVWYYALFGAGLFLRGSRRWLALAVMAVLAGPNIVLLMPVWLVGVGLCHCRWARRVTLESAPIWLLSSFIAVALIARWDMQALFAIRRLVPFSLGMAEWLATDYPLALAVAAGFIGLRPLAERLAGPLGAIAPAVRHAAGFSFTLYLLHGPILLALRQAGLVAGAGPARFAAVLALVMLACAGIARHCERRGDAIRGWLEQALLPAARGVLRPVDI